MASITRAFTTRKGKKSIDISPPMPQRSLTNARHLYPSGTIRDKISAPVELISTTNMLSYSAPDLYPVTSIEKPASNSSKPPSLINSSSASSVHSSEADASPTRSVSTEASGTSTAPTTPGADDAAGQTPTPNHLSCYFEKRTSSLSINANNDTAPGVPSRKLSHTKRTHEVLAHSRSASRLSGENRTDSRISHSLKNSVSSFARDSMQMFNAMPDLVESRAEAPAPARARPRPIISAPLEAPGLYTSTTRSRAGSSSSDPQTPAGDARRPSAYTAHPFGAELAQVSELAEEYATSLFKPAVRVVDDEEAELERAGLFKFAAQEYLAEIESCYVKTYGERRHNGSLESWI